MLTAIGGNWPDIAGLETWVQVYAAGAALLILIAAVIAAMSFLPDLRTRSPENQQDVSDGANVLYFDHIRLFDVDTYLSRLSRARGDTDQAFTDLERAYASQIIVNAKIAARKYRYFENALWLLLAGIATPVVALILYLLVDRNRRREKISESDGGEGVQGGSHA